jgi:hypothetical protein
MQNSLNLDTTESLWQILNQGHKASYSAILKVPSNYKRFAYQVLKNRLFYNRAKSIRSSVKGTRCYHREDGPVTLNSLLQFCSKRAQTPYIKSTKVWSTTDAVPRLNRRQVSLIR